MSKYDIVIMVRMHSENVATVTFKCAVSTEDALSAIQMVIHAVKDNDFSHMTVGEAQLTLIHAMEHARTRRFTSGGLTARDKKYAARMFPSEVFVDAAGAIDGLVAISPSQQHLACVNTNWMCHIDLLDRTFDMHVWRNPSGGLCPNDVNYSTYRRAERVEGPNLDREYSWDEIDDLVYTVFHLDNEWTADTGEVFSKVLDYNG